jgi:hypothetical protein
MSKKEPIRKSYDFDQSSQQIYGITDEDEKK